MIAYLIVDSRGTRELVTPLTLTELTVLSFELNFNLLDLFHSCGYHILSMENSKCMLYITRISRDVRILKKTLEHFLSLTKDCTLLTM